MHRDPDLCGYGGVCLANDAAAGTPCGDVTDTLCGDPDACDRLGTCGTNSNPLPVESCLLALKNQLQVKLNTDPAKNQLKWKWTNGGAFDQIAVGTPDIDTTYSLCVYDSSGAEPSLAAELSLPASPTWVSKDPKGYVLSDGAGTYDGVRKVQLKTGVAAKTKAQLKAAGVSLPFTPASPTQIFEQDPNVVVQLVNSEGLCLTSDLPAASSSKNDGAQFKAKTP